MNRKLISIVVPVYNEEANLEKFYSSVCAVMSGQPYRWELLFIDDGSTDSSRRLLDKIARDHRVKPIFLTRNYGHQIALTCGLDHADGDAVITMDGDLQHPPQILPALLRRWGFLSPISTATSTSMSCPISGTSASA